MPSEKELFVTKQYVPHGQPIVQNENTVIYRVKCLCEPGTPEGILKMYRHKNIETLYTRLLHLDYSEWPHIYNVKFFDGNTLVVEEYLNGNTLEELLQQNHAKGVTFSEEEAYRIMTRLCDCLTQLMKPQPPIIHYNLKPSNIFITSTGAVKLLDFVPGTQKKNQTQKIMNLLGAIFHRMLTGRNPQNNKCTYEGRYKPVIRKCIEKNPGQQYNDIHELQEELEYAREHEPEKSSPEIVGIPYALTIPFQGTILAFEWILLSFFRQKNNLPTMCLFALIFFIHSIVFAVRRHAFLKKRGIYLSIARKALPVLGLAVLLFCLSWVISFLI